MATRSTNHAGLRRMLGIAIAPLVLVALLAGCGGDGSDEIADTDTDDATTEQPDGVTPGDEDEPSDTTDDADATGAEGAAIDACERFSADDFAQITGVAADSTEPLTQIPTGVLGGCTHTAADVVPMVSVTFHESDLWEEFLAGFGVDQLESVAIDGGEAYDSADLGLFFLPEGESWYLQVLAMPGEGAVLGAYSTELATEVVQVIMSNS